MRSFGIVVSAVALTATGVVVAGCDDQADKQRSFCEEISDLSQGGGTAESFRDLAEIAPDAIADDLELVAEAAEEQSQGATRADVARAQENVSDFITEHCDTEVNTGST